MIRLVVRTVRAHWRRFVLTTSAVVLGVSFVVGSFVLTDSLAASINSLLADSTGHTDLVIRAADGSGGGRGGPGGGGGEFGIGRGPRGGVPSALAAMIAATPGVSAVDVLVAGPAQLLDKAGNASGFDFTPLSNWPDHPDMGALRLTSGRAPTGSDDAVIDTATAADRQLRLGSSIRVGTRRGVVTAHVVGLAERSGGNLGAAGTILAFTASRATELVGTDGNVDSINIEAVSGVDHDALRRQLSAVAGPTVSVLRADTLLADARARIQTRLSTFNSLMLGFAAVTLFVSAFLIWNTFSIVVAQRRRELALLRAIGATATQVSRSVIGEGAVVGAVSSAVGIGLGVLIAIGLRKLLGTFGVDLPASRLVLAPRTIVVGLVAGLGVTLVSVISPARKATRVPPVAAMQAAAVPPTRGEPRSGVVGLVILVGGLLLGVRGVTATSMTTTGRMGLLAGGAALVFVGVTSVARFLTAPVVGMIARPIRGVGGVASKLARQNAVRDPRRTASTAAALMIGIALVATTLVLGDSVKAAFGGSLRASITADVVVDAGGIVPFDNATLSALRSTEGVQRLTPIPFARANLAGTKDHNRIGITTADPAELSRAVDPSFTAGSWPTDDGHLAVSKSFADEQHLALGSTITLHAESGDRPLTVSGIYQRDELLDDAVARPAAVAGIAGVEVVTQTVLVAIDSGADPTTVVHQLNRAASTVPNSSARTADDYVTSETSSLDLVLGIVDLLLLFAVAVAGMGIANTLALSVVERTRELGLLRSVGMERRSVRRMVRVEGVLVALFGGSLGLILGVGFGAATTVTLPSDTAQLTFPVLRLLLLLLAAGVLGVLASAVPARRAARLEILDAIADP